MTTATRTMIAALAIAAAGCSAQNATVAPPGPAPGVVFDGSLDDLAPFRHGNAYRYLVAADDGEERRIESRCSVAGNRVFLSVFEDSKALARTEMVLTDDALMIVSEMSPQHDFAFTYDPPVPVLHAPLRSGVNRFQARVRAWRPSNGEQIGEGEAEISWSAHFAPREMTDASIEIRTVKTITMDGGQTSKMQSKRWLAPGVGEIGSSGTTGNGRTEFRELECAQIGERYFGSCGEPIVRVGP